MNVFLVHPSPGVSADRLIVNDPVRARCQLKEACQLLATVDLLHYGRTSMLTAAGDPYKRAHPHHPVTARMTRSTAMYLLCMEVAVCLATRLPGHGSAASLRAWISTAQPVSGSAPLVVVRKDMPNVDVDTYQEYAALMRPYLEAKLGRTYRDL